MGFKNFVTSYRTIFYFHPHFSSTKRGVGKRNLFSGSRNANTLLRNDERNSRPSWCEDRSDDCRVLRECPTALEGLLRDIRVEGGGVGVRSQNSAECKIVIKYKRHCVVQNLERSRTNK